MIIGHFLSRARAATATRRAECAGALARAYLHAELGDSERREAELALVSLADDPSPLVRRALAETFAADPRAPGALVFALSRDQPDVAAPILTLSPLLTEDELIDCAAVGDALAQAAIARRAELPASVCAALAEIGAREAVIALAANPGATLPEFSMRRMVERFGDDGELREALLSRLWLPATVRSDLVNAAAASLTAFALGCGWLSRERAERLSREERDRANVSIAADAVRDGRQGLRALVKHLGDAGRLTPSLILRALLSGDRALFAATLAELTDVREGRIEGLMRDFEGAGFAALYARAGLPESLLPIFRTALAAQRVCAHGGADAGLSLPIVERVLAASGEISGAELSGLTPLLRRFQYEAAREEARKETAKLAADTGFAGIHTFAFNPESAPSPLLIDLDAFEAELMQAAA